MTEAKPKKRGAMGEMSLLMKTRLSKAEESSEATGSEAINEETEENRGN